MTKSILATAHKNKKYSRKIKFVFFILIAVVIPNAQQLLITGESFCICYFIP